MGVSRRALGLVITSPVRPLPESKTVKTEAVSYTTGPHDTRRGYTEARANRPLPEKHPSEKRNVGYRRLGAVWYEIGGVLMLLEMSL